MAREELKERYYTHGRARRNSDWYFDSLDELIEETAEELRYLRECRKKGGPLVVDGEIIALDINPQGYKSAHFATFSPKLVEPMVRAGSSERGVCAARIKKLQLRQDLTEEERDRVYARLGSRGIV